MVANQKITLVSGCFNVLHPGHLRLLRFAKELGNKLVVVVQSDSLAGNAAHVPEHLRLEGVQSNSWVDEAFISEDKIEIVIEKLRPAAVVKGKEHEFAFNPEASAVSQYGGRLIYSSGETTFSSLYLIRREYSYPMVQRSRMPLSFMNRHGINKIRLAYIMKEFSRLKVIVVGDLIVDEYITCEPLGMSQEDPTIVVTPVDSTRFIGGAGIVAAHAAGMGASVKYFSVSGDDECRQFALKKLKTFGVKTHILFDESRPTTLKQRYRCYGKSLLRVSHLHQTSISTELQEKIASAIEKEIEGADLLVFSDFNYGCLPQTLIDRLLLSAKINNLSVAADSQSSSQIGDICRFKGMDLITPTEREARISTRDIESGLVILAEDLIQRSSAKNVILTLGAEGILIHSNIKSTGEWHTDRIGALNTSPMDVSGAGDSLFISSAMTLALGGSIWEAGCIGSLAAGVQVGRVGNTPIDAKELLFEIERVD
jgi:rfaE bifunctional protein kinase chain/domain